MPRRRTELLVLGVLALAGSPVACLAETPRAEARGQASGPDGGRMTAASRVSGVAPLAVFFDAVDTVPSGPASPFEWRSGVYQPPDGDHEGVSYAWDFGDPGAGAWSTTGLSRNSATGYTAAHVYEGPGVYTARLTVTDKAGRVRTYEETITVGAFAGKTYYVAADGDDANGGTDPAAPFATVAKGFSAVNGGPNRRLLLRRGDRFSTPGVTITARGPGMVGAYGSGDRPVLAVTGSSSGIVLRGADDWRLVDLDITYAGAAEPGASGISVAAHQQTVNALVLRTRTTSFRAGMMSEVASAPGRPQSPHDGLAFVECEVAAPHVNGLYQGGRRLAIMGCDVHDVATSHVARVWQAHKAVISNNRLWNPGPTRHALKLHGSKYGSEHAETRWVTISDNLIRGKTWSVAIGPQNGQSDERVSHVVFERNRFRGEPSVRVDLLVWASQVVIRNNVFDGTGAGSDYTGVVVEQRGVEPPPRHVRVLNNTFARADAASEFCALKTAPAAEDVTFRNNLASAPLARSRTLQSGAPGPGFASDHNLVTRSQDFVGVSIGDFSLRATSPAVDAGADVPEVRTDHLGVGRPRGRAHDLGAFEAR